MKKKTVHTDESKRISFYPFRQDHRRIQAFADRFAREHGLRVHPTQREVFKYILDFAEVGLAADRPQQAA